MSSAVMQRSLSKAIIGEIAEHVSSGLGLSAAAAAVQVDPLDLDRFLASPAGASARKDLRIALAQADHHDLMQMEADSDAFSWQAASSRMKMRNDEESRRRLGETNLVCQKELWG